MQVKMIPQLLIPCMQDRNEAQLPSQTILWILPEFKKGFRYALKQNFEHDRFIAQDNGVQIMGQGEHRVKIFYR